MTTSLEIDWQKIKHISGQRDEYLASIPFIPSIKIHWVVCEDQKNLATPDTVRIAFACPFCKTTDHVALGQFQDGLPTLLTCHFAQKQAWITWGDGEHHEAFYELSFWKGIKKWLYKDLKDRYTVKEAFQLITEKGCPFFLLEDKVEDRPTLIATLKAHAKLAKSRQQVYKETAS